MDIFSFTDKKTFFLTITLVIVVIFGLFLRIYDLSSSPYWMDEGNTIDSVLQIEKNGVESLFSSENLNCATICYPTALIAKIFGDNSFSFRIIPVLFGLAFIFLFYKFGEKLFNKKIALFSAIFVSLSYWQIAWSRQSRWYTELEFFFWASLLFFYQYLFSETKKNFYLILTILLTLLTMATHPLGYILPFLYGLLILWKNTKIDRKAVSKKELIIFGSFFIFSLILLFPFLKEFISGFKISYTVPYYLSFYIQNYWLFFLFSIFAIFEPNSEFRKQTIFLLFVVLVAVVPLFFFTDIVNYRYLFHISPVFFLLGSVGLIHLIDKIKKTYLKYIVIAIFFFVFVLTGMGVIIPRTDYYLESDSNLKIPKPWIVYTPQPDFNSAYNSIKKISDGSDGKNIIISAYPKFNNIFFGNYGYGISYDETGRNKYLPKTTNDEIKIIYSLDDLKTAIKNKHGFVVLDYMSIDGRIPLEISNYIKTKMFLVFFNERNAYSKIWVYRF